jgi:hypothetical protein
MSTIRSSIENLIEAIAVEHESRTKHNFRRPDDYRQHCNVCFYLKMAEADSMELPGDNVTVITRLKRGES